MSTNKISIRFFNDQEVRAVWDEENSKWWFSVLDIVGVLNEQREYEKNRNYWKYLKAKLKKENPELVSAATQLKLTAADGKKYKSDVMDYNQIIELAQSFPNNKSAPFIQWFTYSDETIDGKSKAKAYEHQRQAALEEAHQAEKELKTRWVNLQEEYQLYVQKYQFYKNEALPEAERIVKANQLGYSAGEISYVEYLYTLQTAVDTRLSYLESIEALNQKVIEIQSLLNQ